METARDIVARRVAEVAKLLALEHRGELDRLKARQADCERLDFVWHYLLQSFATQGGSSGWQGLILTAANYDRVRFDVLEGLAPQTRRAHALDVCRDAKLRWPEKKANYIVAAFDRIVALGGLAAARTALFGAPGSSGKMAFLKTFLGIGDKYARNLMMDVYHEEFRSVIAVDARIKSLSADWGLTFESYQDHERFYLAVADRAGLNGWELDRLLYNFAPEFRSRVPQPPSARVPRR